MNSQIYKYATRSFRSLLFTSKHKSSNAFTGQAAAVATTARGLCGKTFAESEDPKYVIGLLSIPIAVGLLLDTMENRAEQERTFIAIKPEGVHRGYITEIMSLFERKGFRLVAIKLVVTSKEFALKHHLDNSERPFIDTTRPVPALAMVWEGKGVIQYGQQLMGARESGNIGNDLAVVLGRNIIHGSIGPESAKDEIKLWFKPEEVKSYSNKFGQGLARKW